MRQPDCPSFQCCLCAFMELQPHCGPHPLLWAPPLAGSKQAASVSPCHDPVTSALIRPSLAGYLRRRTALRPLSFLLIPLHTSSLCSLDILSTHAGLSFSLYSCGCSPRLRPPLIHSTAAVSACYSPAQHQPLRESIAKHLIKH